MAEKSGKFDQIKYQNNYISTKYDRINLTVPKGQKDIIRQHAAASSESMNEYICRSIRMRMEAE